MDMRGPHGPKNTLIVAPTVIIHGIMQIKTLQSLAYLFYQIMQFLGSAAPRIYGSASFLVNPYEG